MHRLFVGTYIRFVFGEYATGCWFLPPIAEGQMSFVFLADEVCFSGFSIGRPVLRSTPVAQLTTTNGSAMRSSPVVRSSMYANPLRSKLARTFRGCPLILTSIST